MSPNLAFDLCVYLLAISGQPFILRLDTHNKTLAVECAPAPKEPDHEHLDDSPDQPAAPALGS